MQIWRTDPCVWGCGYMYVYMCVWACVHTHKPKKDPEGSFLIFYHAHIPSANSIKKNGKIKVTIFIH